jgi:hypothetical protein
MNLLTCGRQLYFTKKNGGATHILLTPKIAKAMKLTFIFLTAALLQVAAKGKSQVVSFIYERCVHR